MMKSIYCKRNVYGLSMILLLLTSPARAEDWLQFRGSDNTGLVSGPLLPTTLESLNWQQELPGRGLSSPIIVNGQVIVTACDGYRQDRLIVLSFSEQTGQLQWKREFWATGRTICHQKMSVATPTPASDGESIYAFYSSNDVLCLDLNGNLKWYRGLTFDFPNVSNSLGMSSSPIVIGETVVCMAENDTESITFGLNTADGTTRWQLDRPRSANWTSPVIWPGENTLVMLQSSQGVAAVDPLTGKTVWEFLDGAATIPSLAVVNNIAYVPSNGLTAIKPGTSDPQTPEILWQASQLKPSTPSPIVADGRAYVVNAAGVLVCADITNGERLWQARLTGKFSATPIISGDRLYIVSEEGNAQIVQLSTEAGEVIATKELGEAVLATPSAANGAVYFRSDRQLWKFGQ